MRGVGTTGGIARKRVRAAGGIVITSAVGGQRVNAKGGILRTGHRKVARLHAHKRIQVAEIVNEALEALDDDAGRRRRIHHRQIAGDVVGAGWTGCADLPLSASDANWPLRPRRARDARRTGGTSQPRRPLRPRCTDWTLRTRDSSDHVCHRDRRRRNRSRNLRTCHRRDAICGGRAKRIRTAGQRLARAHFAVGVDLHRQPIRHVEW